MNNDKETQDNQPLTRRSRQPQRSRLVITKKAIIGVGIIVAIALILLVGKAVMSFGTKNLDDNVAISKWANFEKIKAVEGFTDPVSRSYTGASALVAKQSTNSITKKDGTCEFTGQISHIPSYNAGRGDRYLSENYVYTLGEGNGVTPELDTVKFNSNSGKIEAVNASYEYETTVPNIDGEDEKVSKYRSVAVRVFDSVVDIEGLENTSEGQFGSDSTKGLPVAVFTYDCNTENDFSTKEWKKLLNSVTVDLNASEMPEYDDGKNPPAEPSEENSSPAITEQTPDTEPSTESMDESTEESSEEIIESGDAEQLEDMTDGEPIDELLDENSVQ